jgi:hypothetical protein
MTHYTDRASFLAGTYKSGAREHRRCERCVAATSALPRSWREVFDQKGPGHISVVAERTRAAMYDFMCFNDRIYRVVRGPEPVTRADVQDTGMLARDLP